MPEVSAETDAIAAHARGDWQAERAALDTLALAEMECVRCGAFATVLPEAGPVLCKEHGGRRF